MCQFLGSLSKSLGVILLLLGVVLFNTPDALADGPGAPGTKSGCLWINQCATFNGISCPTNSCIFSPFCEAIGGYPEGSRCCCNW